MNRDVAINTFEGGLDLDSDVRLIQPNKMRASVNTDIRKSGNAAAITDLKGETLLQDIEGLPSGDSFYMLAASPETSFLIEPTQESVEAVVFFYIKEESGSYFFRIKAYFIGEDEIQSIYEEQITEEDFNKLKDSTIDFEKVGQFGYDIIYFVDSRRQPRKLECLIERINDNELTLSLSGTSQGSGFVTVNLSVNSSGTIQMPFRAYVYGYKQGGPTRPSVNSPSTETIKFVEFTSQSSRPVSFVINEADYDNWVFEIVYHKEGSIIYRNFIIGDPFRVIVPVGVIPNSGTLLASTSLEPSNTQLNSWSFLYEGGVVTLYNLTSSSGWNQGDIVYRSPIASSENLALTGFYQVNGENSFIYIINGTIIGTGINNANISFATTPIDIESAVRSEAAVITEGNRNRLSELSYNVPLQVTVGGVDYDFTNIDAGSKSSSGENIWSFTLERPDEVLVIATYQSVIVSITGNSTGVNDLGGGNYQVTLQASISRALSEPIEIGLQQRAFDSDSGSELTPVTGTVTIPAGQTVAADTFAYNHFDPVNFVDTCVSGVTYFGVEQLNITNPCSI